MAPGLEGSWLVGAELLGDQLEVGSALENHAAYLRH